MKYSTLIFSYLLILVMSFVLKASITNRTSRAKKRMKRQIIDERTANKTFVVTEGPVFLRPVPDYQNNYEYGASEMKLVLDLEKLDKKIQYTVIYTLVGIIIATAAMFMIILPLSQIVYLCFKDPKRNVYWVRDYLICREPAYTYVKEKGKAEGLNIPNYKEYKKLMKQYPEDTLQKIRKQLIKELENIEIREMAR